MGLLFTLIAVAAWGLGDFLIQRSARKVGDWEALFFITFLGAIVLLPFVYKTLGTYTSFEWVVMIATSLVIFFAAVLDFDALRIGKIAVIEPVLALEVPITVALSTFVLGEPMTSVQLVLIAALLISIYLVSNKKLSRFRVRTFERGVVVAIVATAGMGIANFLYGVGSRETTPLMINWFTSAFMAAGTLLYIVYYGQTERIFTHLRNNAALIIGMSVSDNIAWIAYSASALYMPIGIAIGLTESYVALAALLGVFVNKERLKFHQGIGLGGAVISAVALALTTQNL